MSELQKVQDEIKSALKKIGCKREVKLVVASKYFSIQEILKLYHAGQRDFGENKVQDALEKIQALPKDIHWHFIGHLQKNKVNKMIHLFDLIHSVDSFELALKISEKSTQKQAILLQVNTSKEATKSGFTKETLFKSLESIESLPHIEVKGLMTLAPHTEDTKQIKKAFKELREIKESLNKKSWHLSMGMSEDFHIAIEEGSDYVRIGRRLLPR